MSRKHGLVISLLLSACVVTGAAAAMQTVHLGAATSTTVKVPNAQIAARKAKLDKWQASLHKALVTKTPKLPAVPKFAPVQVPSVAVAAPVSQPAAPAAAVHTVAVKHHHTVVHTAKPTVTTTTTAAAPPAPAPPVTTVTVQPTAPPVSYGDDNEHHNGGGGDGTHHHD